MAASHAVLYFLSGLCDLIEGQLEKYEVQTVVLVIYSNQLELFSWYSALLTYFIPAARNSLTLFTSIIQVIAVVKKRLYVLRCADSSTA